MNKTILVTFRETIEYKAQYVVPEDFVAEDVDAIHEMLEGTEPVAKTQNEGDIVIDSVRETISFALDFTGTWQGMGGTDLLQVGAYSALVEHDTINDEYHWRIEDRLQNRLEDGTARSASQARVEAAAMLKDVIGRRMVIA